MAIASTSGATARLALTQSLTLDNTMPRRVTVTANVKGENLGQGFSMIRIQAYNASNQIVAAVPAGPYLRESFGWQPYAITLTIPEGATRLTVEPMLDRAAGKLWVTGIGLAEGGLPALLNPSFTYTSTSGAPQYWNAWNPAGTATAAVSPHGGPSGQAAVAITSTSGSSARYALTQNIPVDSSTPRQLRLRGSVKGEGLSGGFSMLRVQGYNAAGQLTMPAAQGPYLTGTFAWKTYTTDIVLPVGTTRLSVEPMLDRSAGTLWFTGLEIVENTATGTLTATATPAGPVELVWSVAVPNTVRYAVHRIEGTTAPAGDATTLVRTAVAPTTADDTGAPGRTYTYVVQALDATGTVLATSPPVKVSTPASFTDRTQSTILTAQQANGGQARVTWAIAANAAPGNLTVQVGARSPQTIQGYEGSIQLSGNPGDEVLLRSGSQVLSTAQVGATAHPRALVDTGTIARVNQQLAAGDATTSAAWQATVDRVAGPDSAYASNGSAGLYRARDAAFLYAASGNQQYAQQAYDGIVAAEGFIAPRSSNMGLELARAALLLAPAYDWAYNGWNAEQRAHVVDLIIKTADLLSTYHHDALDDTVKTSNWVGVVRSTELALLLAARGDTGVPNYDQRVAFLLDQTNQHLEQAYTNSGFTQEGWDYFQYTMLYMLPSIYLAQDTGIRTLDTQLQRPKFWNLALHVVSSRSEGDALQFGVSGPKGKTAGIFPLLFPISPPNAAPGLKHLYDRVQGVASDGHTFDDTHGVWAMLFYPESASGTAADLSAAEAHSALLDDEEGFYVFRSGYANRDDTLIATASRNQQHRGWSSAETFSLSWMSHDTTWATLGGKHWTEPLLWSKPLVDGKLEPYRNQYETMTGAGETLESRAFPDQGGGYLRLDGSGNFQVDTALREEVVDLNSEGAVDAIVVIKDTFQDADSHRWDWQLRPEAGVTVTVNENATEEQPYFTFASPNGTVLSGFVHNRTGITAQVIDGTLRLSRTGTSAEFEIVLATSPTGPLSAVSASNGLVIDGRLIDFDALDTTTPAGLPGL
ncbi:hypothetical protein [Microbacterium sp. Leaf320]|uniref:hypothetical protein n=1 Tax=Microbacterium sp. Leaf320 TaxID=1736334 RepID=UPI0006FE56B6|nr:hypothetical protein [Microbacterium sp. Leaf320]KQQ62562.1 hypothetical protein ASF63_18645 [Microbacterium sp. Leaf320]